ncbi:MAG: helix-turn-helix transcriptional regulator [Akkermansiaceae bacterium]|nr:helix-turn-helix transcriptional regulator [Akkermansiaceae bacterium]
MGNRRGFEKHRQAKGLSMYRIEKLSNISDRSISRMESRNQNPTLFTLLKIAKAQNMRIGPILSKLEKML